MSSAGTVAALVGYTVAVARRDSVWPFVLVIGVGVVAFIAGLAIYGARDVHGDRFPAVDCSPGGRAREGGSASS